MSEIVCPLCDNRKSNSSFYAKERLIGIREDFCYGECSSCKAIFLINIIDDFAKYYPEVYHQKPNYSITSSIKIFALKQVYKYNFFGKGRLGYCIVKIFKKIHGYHPELNISWVGKAYKHINKSLEDISVVDLGCGGGNLLSQLKGVGCKNLLGVEPHLQDYDGDIPIKKQHIQDFASDSKNFKKYDIVILSHVLEHIYDHETILENLKNLLTDGGVLIISMPFTGGLFNKYRENWFSLDAPRHVIIHSLQSFTALLDKVGLSTLDILFEQTYWEIAMSELYGYDIGYFEQKNLDNILAFDKKKHIKLAEALNKNKSGGSCVTYLLQNS